MSCMSEKWLALFLAAFVIAAALELGSAAEKPKKPKKPRKLDFYWHDTLLNTTAPGANTAALVAGPNSDLSNITFGSVVVFNDPLTLHPQIGSKLLGRGQGIYAYDSLKNGAPSNALLVFSALIDTGDFKGTLNFMGADIEAPRRDISVVGGSGDFELARGIATLTTASIQGSTFSVHFQGLRPHVHGALPVLPTARELFSKRHQHLGSG